MKQIRISLPLVTLVLAIAASAFTTLSPKKTQSGPYFFDLTGTDQMDQASYTIRSTQPSPGDVCSGNSVLCGIWADVDPNDNTRPLQSDLDALANAYDVDRDGDFDAQHINEVDFKAP